MIHRRRRGIMPISGRHGELGARIVLNVVYVSGLMARFVIIDLSALCWSFVCLLSYVVPACAISSPRCVLIENLLKISDKTLIEIFRFLFEWMDGEAF